MSIIRCEMCGGTLEIQENAAVAVCEYCGTRITIPKAEQVALCGGTRSSEIALSDDVARLLQKCKTDPKNARKYANLILDIDADNTEALKYL